MKKLVMCLLAACGSSASETEQPADASIDAAPPLFAFEAYFKASDTAANAAFGPLALSAGRLVVGAPGHASTAGAAYAFSRRSTGWEATRTFTGSNTVAGDEFGAAVAIGTSANSADTLVIGAPGAQDDAGAVYLLEELGPSWSQITQPFAGSASEGRFGSAVAIAGDWIVIGAPGEANGTGAAYVFHRSPESGSFSFDQKLTPFSMLEPGDRFGACVALAVVAGQPVVVIAAAGDDDSGSDAGAVYVFERKATWGETFKVLPPADASGFAADVAVSGSTLAVGAPGTAGGGAVYMFARTMLSNAWAPQGRIVASDRADGDRFGDAIEFGYGRLLVGDPVKNDGAGAAYLFDPIAPREVARLTAPNAGSNDGFGTYVANEGTEVAIGAPSEASSATGINGNSASNDVSGSGAAYTFVQTRPEM